MGETVGAVVGCAQPGGWGVVWGVSPMGFGLWALGFGLWASGVRRQASGAWALALLALCSCLHRPGAHVRGRGEHAVVVAEGPLARVDQEGAGLLRQRDLHAEVAHAALLDPQDPGL